MQEDPYEAMARKLSERRSKILGEYDWKTAEDLATSFGMSSPLVVEHWKLMGRAFSVWDAYDTRHPHDIYPMFQFADHEPIDCVRDVITIFGKDKSPWKLAMWFTSNNGWLPDQVRPADVLTRYSQEVIEAARRDAGGTGA